MLRLLARQLLTVSLLLAIANTGFAQELDSIGKQKPFDIHGTVGLGFGTYHVSGIEARQRNFTYLLSGSPVISIYGVSFPLSVVVSDQQRRFTQPFNQYGISPHYKWLTIHAGWRSLTYSPYTLGGYNFFGAGVDLNPGKLRLSFMYGRFNKAISADSSVQQVNYFTLLPAYRRTGYAGKLGFGTEEKHIDFTYFKGKDDTTSIKKLPAAYNITPAENVAVGVSFRYTFFRHLFIEANAAGSIYTRDLRADTVSKTDITKVKIVSNMLHINASSQFLTAGDAAIGYQGNTFGLKVQYKRIDPNYQSMGAYYFETDVENYTVSPSLFLFKRRLSFSGSLGLQHDNLLKDKTATSNKTIGNVSIGYNVTKFGFNVTYSNYGITQDRGLNPIIDTLRIARTNHNISSVLRFSMGNEDVMHNIILVGNLQSLVDLNNKTALQSETNSKTGNLTYQLALNKPGLNISSIFNYTVADAAMVHSIIYGPSVGVDKQVQKLSLSTYFSYQWQNNLNAPQGHYISGTLTGNYRIGRRNGLNATLNYLKSVTGDATLPNFNEFRTNLIYTYTF